jgi:hypothetical protein
MSDRVRVRLDPSVTPEEVRAALVRVTGRDVSAGGFDDMRGARIATFRIGAGVLESDLPAMVLDGGPDTDGDAEVSVYACGPSRETMRALAAELGGRYRGSDYDEGWETPSVSGPGAR